MKKIFTLIIAIAAFSSFGQIELHKYGVSLGDTYAIDSASYSGMYMKSDMYIINNTATQQTISFKRRRNYHTYGWTDQICDDLICFNADDVTLWERPGSPALVVNPGDSSIMQLKVFPNDIPGCAIYTYYVLDGAKVIQDSITVTFTVDGLTCVLGAEEIEEPVFSVYPNPASDQLNIEMSNAGNDDVFKVFNILGEEVRTVRLKEGLNTMNIVELNNGVYFYSVFRNGEVIETKKIVIRH